MRRSTNSIVLLRTYISTSQNGFTSKISDTGPLHHHGAVNITMERSISLIYTAAHGVQILYTLLQVGSLCDIPHILRWDSTSSSTWCCPRGPIWQISHSDPPVKEYIIYCTPAHLYFNIIERIYIENIKPGPALGHLKKF